MLLLVLNMRYAFGAVLFECFDIMSMQHILAYVVTVMRGSMYASVCTQYSVRKISIMKDDVDVLRSYWLANLSRISGNSLLLFPLRDVLCLSVY